MAILDEDVARVREATDMLALVSEHVHLRRVGRSHMGVCPFHAESTPSFSVSAEKGLFYCFGCQKHGDAFDFVMEIDHVDFPSAVEHLAGRAGITLRHDSERATRERGRRTKLVATMRDAVAWYHERLLSGADAAAARSYLRSRGYDGDVVRRFQLGWAPDGWDELVRALKLTPDVARDTGLGYVNRVNRLNDSFRARILFPIFDVSGDPVAFGGRKLPDAEGPKYKNSSETPLYSKSSTLYGLNWAKASIVEAGEVVVCEGYTDVIAFHSSGVPQAVATCGTALAEDHFKVLKKFARRVVLAYDADSAGQSAADRFYEWERRHELDVAVVALPSGADPADVARRDPAGLRQAVQDARPFLSFRLERLLERANLATAEGRGRAFEAAAALIGEHPSPYVREQYLNEVADRCRISEETMARVLAAPPRTPPSRPAAPAGGRRAGEDGRDRPDAAGRPGPSARRPQRPPAGTVRGRATSVRTLAAAATARLAVPEREALRWVVVEPEAVLAWLDASFFVDPVHQRAYAALLDAHDVHDAVHGLHASGDEECAALLHRLAVEDPGGEPDPADAVARLVRSVAIRTIAELSAPPAVGAVDAGEANAAGVGVDASDASAAVGQLKLLVEALDDPVARPDALNQLVPWLAAWRNKAGSSPLAT